MGKGFGRDWIWCCWVELCLFWVLLMFFVGVCGVVENIDKVDDGFIDEYDN